MYFIWIRCWLLYVYACVIHQVLNMSGMFWAPILSPNVTCAGRTKEIRAE